MDIYKVMNLIDDANLSPAKTKILYGIIVRINRNFWKPLSIPATIVGRGMSKDTFLKERKALVADGWIVMKSGEWKTASAVYGLGSKFIQDTNSKTKGEVRTRNKIKELVVEIDRKYPDFAGFCARYKWDKAIELFKAEHAELVTTEWPIDEIGDPANREQAHLMLVKLFKGKIKLDKKSKATSEPSAWDSFFLFVDMWRLSYPKKAARAAVMNAVKELAKTKEQWTPDQIRGLQENITSHTQAYVESFGTDTRFMVSPVNYFMAEKWTEKLPVIRDKTDINSKTAGASTKPNMPQITVIKAN